MRRWIWLPVSILTIAALTAALCFTGNREALRGLWKPHPDWWTRGVLAGAVKVEAFRLDGHDGPETEPEKRKRGEGVRRIGYWLITAQGQDQGKEFADKLTGILLDDKTYSGESAKCFYPGVAFRIWKGQESVDVLLCFHCDNFYCGPMKPIEMDNASFHGTPARPQLVRLAKESFPDDEEIQALEEK